MTPTCSICGNPLQEGQSTIKTSGCAFPMGHELWKYCESWMHLECVATWPHRKKFAFAYFEQRYKQYINEGWIILSEEETYFLGHIPYGHQGVGRGPIVELVLAEWPWAVVLLLEDWEGMLGMFLNGELFEMPADFARDVQVVIEQLATMFPTEVQLKQRIIGASLPSPLNEKARCFMEFLWCWIYTLLEDWDKETTKLGEVSFLVPTSADDRTEIAAMLLGVLCKRLRMGLEGISVPTGKAMANAIEKAVRLYSGFGDVAADELVRNSIVYGMLHDPEASPSELNNSRLLGRLMTRLLSDYPCRMVNGERYATEESTVALTRGLRELFPEFITYWQQDGVKLPAPRGASALFYCLVNERLDWLRTALAARQSPDRPATERVCAISPKLIPEGGTLVHTAQIMKNQEALELLMRHGASLNISTAEGTTPLHRAVRDEDAELVRWLLRERADYSAGDKFGNTPYHYAHSLEILDIFASKGVDFNLPAHATGYTPLHMACCTHNVMKIRFLLKQGAFAGAQAHQGQTPLHMLVSQKYLDVDEAGSLLLRAGANVRAVDYEGNTPLHWAAGVNARNNFLDRGNAKAILWLCENGADPRVRNQHGMTAMDVAWKIGDSSVKNMFSEIGIKPIMKFRFL